jgi:hypothetical protein
MRAYKSTLRQRPRLPVATESQYRTREVILKAIGVPLVIMAAGWAAWQYYDKSQTDKMECKQREAQEYAHRLFDKKLRAMDDLIAKSISLSLNAANPELRTQFLISYRQLQAVAGGNNKLAIAFKPIYDCLNQNCDAETVRAAVQEAAPAAGKAVATEVKERIIATGVAIGRIVKR